MLAMTITRARLLGTIAGALALWPAQAPAQKFNAACADGLGDMRAKD